MPLFCSYRHPNLVAIFGVCTDPENPAICYEMMENGSLWECVAGKCKVCDLVYSVYIFVSPFPEGQ